MLRAALLAALASLALVTGCTHHVAPVDGKPALEVGTGENEDSFDAIGPGVSVPLNYGSQGGEHIWFAARVKGIGANAALTYSITDEKGAVVSKEQSVMLPDDTDDEGWRTLGGLTAFVDDGASVQSGMKVIFHGHVEDEAGHTLDATADATVDSGGGWI